MNKNLGGGRCAAGRLLGLAARGFACAALLWHAGLGLAQTSGSCTAVLARVVSVQGQVELRRGDTTWPAIQLDATLCAGDTVRVQAHSRAALRLNNETTLRLDQGTVLTLAPSDRIGPTLMEQLKGRLHVITRTPRPFHVRTPFVNANVQGTEFTVRVDETSTTVTVIEGVVVAANSSGSVELKDGQAATARQGGGAPDIVVRSADAVNWTLHVPAVLDFGALRADATLARSAALAQSGRIDQALAALALPPDGPAGAGFHVYRAALLLQVGRFDEAKPDIAQALKLEPSNSNAHALLAMVAVVENDKSGALALARQSVREDARSSAALISLSYAEQASFELEAARVHAIEATQLEPANALAHARRAELELSLGRLAEAVAAAQEAVRLHPGLARTQSILGFADLSRTDTRSARASFGRAIELDSADPLPRLGLGLARIREGDLGGGREDIEIAVSLDPGNALARSYLGKAYYEEKRDARAEVQFALAIKRDPRDPTPYLYGAVLAQSQNRPVQALLDLDQSIALNGNRAVYRSQLLLDKDQATRSTNRAATYQALGFERLAIAESVKALAEDLGAEAAHRQLASAYANLPRHDIARASEALQAQIRQPLTATPIDPQLNTDHLGILRGDGPSRLGANEFNQLFSRDQVRLQADAVVGSRGTRGDQVMVSGLSGQFAYALSQLYYETDGFGDNNSARKEAVDLFVQAQLSSRASLQAELKHSELRVGQTFFPFDPLVIYPQTIRERREVARLSGHLDQAPGVDWIFSLSHENRLRAADNFPDGSPITETKFRTDALELQHLRRSGPVQLVLGFSRLRESGYSPFEAVEVTDANQAIYAYGLWQIQPGRLSLQAGLAAEQLDIRNPFFVDGIHRRRVSPKLGMVWTPTPETTFRLASFTAVKRPFIASQTLEPTQIAGFNQFFTGFEAFFGDPDGTISRRTGLGFDQKLPGNTFAGAEVSVRQLDVPSLIAARDFRWRERTAHLYLYRALAADSERLWLPGWSAAASIEYEVEKLERPQILTGPEGIMNVTTQRLPMALRLFQGNLSLRLSTTYLRQTGEFSADVALDRFSKSTGAWISDVSAEYRLPRRMGTLAVGVRNLADRPVELFQSDPFAPRDALGRFAYARVRVVF